MRIVAHALLAATCGAMALVPFSEANAVSLTIVGGTQNVPGFAGYGSGINQNNVITKKSDTTPGVIPEWGNFPALFGTSGSGIVDPTNNGSTFFSGASAHLAVTGSSGIPWTIEWFYLGSESGFVNTFFATSVGGAGASVPLPGQMSPSVTGTTLLHSENDLNNNYASLTPRGRQYLGYTRGFEDGVINFGFTNNAGGAVVNGANNNSNVLNVSALVFSYATFLQLADEYFQQVFELTATGDGSFVIIALNDSGSDDNHDDYVLMARIYEAVHFDPVIPIPGTLPLFVTGLGALGLIAYRRKRKQAA